MNRIPFLAGRRFTKHVAVTLTVQGVGLLLAIATAAITARWLGPEGKGIVALALLVPGMLGLFLSSGIGVANVYLAGSRREEVSTLVANSVGLAIPTTALGIGLVGLFTGTGWLAKLVPGVSLRWVLLAMWSLPLSLLNGYFTGILQGLQCIVQINVVNLAQSVLLLALTALLVIAFPLGIQGALLAYLGAAATGVAVLAVMLRRQGGDFKPRFNLRVVRAMLSFGLRGHVGNILQFFNYRLDMLLVNYFLNPAQVGIYTVSVRLAELLWNLPNAVSFVIFPKAAATKPEAMNVFTPRVLRVTLGLTLLGALGLAALGQPVILLVYTAAFRDAYVPMLALLPGIVLLGGAKVLANEIAGRGFPHYNSITSGLALILTVVLDLWLIPRYQVLGASIASTVAYSASFFLSLGFYRFVSRKTVSALTDTPVVESER